MSEVNIYSAMQTGNPLKVYRKTIVGKVHIHNLNPFNDKPEYTILEGSPGTETAQIKIWDEKQDAFLRAMNKTHFREGRLIEVESHVLNQEQEEDTPSPNQITDDEIVEVLSSPFLSLKAKLDSFTSVAPVYRMLTKAEELEKSEKIIKRIKEKLSELDLSDYE